MKGMKQADVLMEGEISGETGACTGRIIDVSKMGKGKEIVSS